jgi:hypothetical protein
VAEPRPSEDPPGFSDGRPKVCAGSKGSVQAGGQSVMRPVRLRGSPTAVTGSKGMHGIRAKIIVGSADFYNIEYFYNTYIVLIGDLWQPGGCRRFLRDSRWSSTGCCGFRNGLLQPKGCSGLCRDS